MMAAGESMIPLAQAQSVIPDLRALTTEQFAWVERLVKTMALPANCVRNPASDVFPDDDSAGLLFLFLITHHTLSAESFKKEKCEYALVQIMTTLRRTAVLAKSRTNPGHDLTVDGSKWSVKSEAHRDIEKDFILMSKWMELGKGKWDEEADLHTLCAKNFQGHLANYDRIFVFRCLTPTELVDHHYELLEIPKTILVMACSSGVFIMTKKSKQTPKPGYCRVSDERGLMYQLYFDGETERKLRLQKLRRDLCAFHAEWKFESTRPFWPGTL
jgi:Type II site-specific deoxyribonuclease